MKLGLLKRTENIYNPELEKLILPLSKKYEFPKKHIFLRPGDKFDGIYYIYKGSTKHYMTSEDGIIKLLYILNRGRFYGESSFFLNVPTENFSEAETDVILYKMPKDAINELMDKSKIFRENIIRGYSEKCLILRYEVANLSFNNSKNRLKQIFCSIMDLNSLESPNWYALEQHFTHQELGEIIGTTRVTISRQINELCNEGFLRIVNRKYQINKSQAEQYLNINTNLF